MSRPEQFIIPDHHSEAVYAVREGGSFGDTTRALFLETMARNLYAVHEIPLRKDALMEAFAVFARPRYMSPDDVRAFCRAAENRGGPSSLPPEIVTAFDTLMTRITAAFADSSLTPSAGHDILVAEMDIFNRTLPRDYSAGTIEPPLSLTRHGIRIFATMMASRVQQDAQARVLEMPFFGFMQK